MNIQAINALFFSRYGMVVRIARKYAPDAGLAHDIIQQSYIDFAQGIKKQKWDIPDDIGPLLATIVKNAALRSWRTRQREASKIDRMFGEMSSRIYRTHLMGPDETDWEDELDAMKQCVDLLPPKSRELIDLHYFFHASTLEIADMIGAGQRTIQQALRRIRKKLQHCIEIRLKQKEIDRLY